MVVDLTSALMQRPGLNALSIQTALRGADIDSAVNFQEFEPDNSPI
jgi:hypothetical protein